MERKKLIIGKNEKSNDLKRDIEGVLRLMKSVERMMKRREKLERKKRRIDKLRKERKEGKRIIDGEEKCIG